MLKKKLLAQYETDVELVTVLRQHADDPKAIHAVEHHFLARHESELEAVADLGKKLGFEASAIQEQKHEGKRRFFFDLVSHTTTEVAKLSRDALLMHAFAAAFEVTYDGWGTGIMRTDEPKKTAKPTPKKTTKSKKKTAR